MKEYEDKEVVTRQVCTRLKCDACGDIANMPASECWIWGGVGIAYGKIQSVIEIDGESLGETMDLCPDCAGALIRDVAAGRWRRTNG